MRSDGLQKLKLPPFDSWTLIWHFITAEFEVSGCFCGKTQRILRYKHGTSISKSILKTYAIEDTHITASRYFALRGCFSRTSVGRDSQSL